MVLITIIIPNRIVRLVRKNELSRRSVESTAKSIVSQIPAKKESLRHNIDCARQWNCLILGAHFKYSCWTSNYKMLPFSKSKRFT